MDKSVNLSIERLRRDQGLRPSSPKGSTLTEKCLAISCRWQGRDLKKTLQVDFVFDRLAITVRIARYPAGLVRYAYGLAER